MRRGRSGGAIALLALAAWGRGGAAQGASVQLHGRGEALSPGPADPRDPPAAGLRTVTGRVERLTARGPVGVGGVMATLHRVGPDRQGPVDSMRTLAEGGYRFRYRAAAGDRAIWFVSATWSGITYFTPPLREARVDGAAALVTVFDNASTGVPLHVRGRHLIVGAIDSTGARTVIEVYELANDSARTLVGRDSTAATWTALLPDAAHGVAMGRGEVTAAAAAFDAGRLRLFAPFAPGLKQFSFSYQLPQDAFPLPVPAAEPVTVLEVLVEQADGTATGAGLRETEPVSGEARTFRRFLAQDVPAGAVVTIVAPARRPASRVLQVYGVAIAVGAALLVGLAGATWRARGARAGAAAGDDPGRLAREIADLDAAHDKAPSPDGLAREMYARRRAALTARLTEALARRDGDA